MKKGILAFIIFSHCLSFATDQVEELFSAINKKELTKVKKILNSGNFNLNKIRNYKGDSVLDVAVKSEKLKLNSNDWSYGLAGTGKKWNHQSQNILDFLIQAGADVNLAGRPLEWAVKYKRVSAVKTLLKAGADPNKDEHFLHGVSTPNRGDSSRDRINQMLLQAGSKILLFKKENEQKIDAILKMPVDRIEKDKLIRKETQAVVSFKKFKEAFLKDSSKLDANQAIRYYSFIGLLPVVQFLIDFGVDLNYKDPYDARSLIDMVALEVNESVLYALLSSGRINKKTTHSTLLLHSSDSVFAQAKSLEILLSHYPDWAKTQSAEKNLLKLSYNKVYKKKYIHIIKILLLHGTNPHVQASKEMFSDLSEIQIKQYQHIWNEKKTAYEKIKENGNKELINFMQNFSCRSLFK